MKLKEDVIRLAQLLLDEPVNKKGVGTTTIYSFYDKFRHPHGLTYRIPNVVPKMEELSLLKILEIKEHGKAVGMEIQLFPYYKVQFFLAKLQNHIIKRVEKPTLKKVTGAEKEFRCGELGISLSIAKMQYKNKSPIDISPDNDEIKFLVLLMAHKERVVEYTAIARNLNLNCYHENVNNKDVARPVQLLKKSTKKLLRKVGLTQKEFENLIIPKKNLGYILSCK